MYGKDSNVDTLDKYKVTARFRVPSGKDYTIVFNVEIKNVSGSIEYIVEEVFDYDTLSYAAKILDDLLNIMPYNDAFFDDPVSYILEIFNKYYNIDKRRGTFYNNISKAVEYLVIRDVIGYRAITPLLSDPDVEDISLSAPNTYVLIWHKRYNSTGWIKTNIFIDDKEVKRIITKLAFRSGKSISILKPVLEGVLPENYRVVATWLNEVSPRGSSFTIRKFKARPYTITELISSGVLPLYVAAYLWTLVTKKRFIMIIGPSGAGKTTLLNSLLHLIPMSKRIVSIEETPEIYLYNHIGWKPLTTRWDRETLDEILNLLKYSLRERADYIVLGESRGLEARLVFQGAATGHGCITTFHASTLKELYARLKSKPISLDQSMFKLLDTVVIMKFFYENDSHIRKVEKVYKQIGNKWKLLYDLKMDPDEYVNNIYAVLDDEEKAIFDTYYKFLNYLIKLKIFDYDEFITRINLFYSGRYRYVGNRWVLNINGGESDGRE